MKKVVCFFYSLAILSLLIPVSYSQENEIKQGYVATANNGGKLGCLPKQIFKHWVQSYEEDTKDFRVFRASDYNFPPSRGRWGFEIKEDGKFILHSTGPDDRPVEFQGYWKTEGKDKIIGYFEKDGKTQQWIINIITCSEDALKVKK